MSLIQRVPWSVQPQVGVGVDPSIFSAGSSLWNLTSVVTPDRVGGTPTTLQGSTHKVQATPNGLGVYCATQSTANYIGTGVGSVTGNSPRSLIVVYQHVASAGYVTIAQTGTQGTEDFSIVGQNTGVSIDLRFNCWGRTSVDVPLNALPINQVVCAIFTHNGTTREGFVNGKSYGTQTSVLNTQAGNVRIAGGNTLNGPTAPVLLVALLPYGLSRAQSLFLSANPWQLFEPLPKRIWAPASAGGAYTVTADAGAYTIAGQDAALVRGRIVTADAGAYSLAGQDAALKVGHLITADAGAYSIAGQDATLLRGRVVTADPGAYAVAGQDATLNYVGAASTYTLTCDAGAYSLAGQAASLLLGRVMSAGAGAYALSGQDAAIRWSGEPSAVVSAGGGGIWPEPRRRTKKEIEEQRIELGILPPEEVQTGIVEVPKRPRISLEQLIGKPAADTHRADMERASAAHKLRKRRQDDDLLMMM